MNIFYGYFIIILIGIVDVIVACEDGYSSPVRGTKCKAYSKCTLGRFFLHFCEEGSLFDPRSRSCRDDVGCSDQTTECEEYTTYKHVTDCRSYYQCTQGKLVVKTCPRGNSFNGKSDICNSNNENCIDEDFENNEEPHLSSSHTVTLKNDIDNKHFKDNEEKPKCSPCRIYDPSVGRCVLFADYHEPPSTSSLPSTTAETTTPSTPSYSTTSKPPSTTTKPRPTTTKPRPTTTKPRPTTTKPHPTTTKPRPTTTKPHPTTTKTRPTTTSTTSPNPINPSSSEASSSSDSHDPTSFTTSSYEKSTITTSQYPTSDSSTYPSNSSPTTPSPTYSTAYPPSSSSQDSLSTTDSTTILTTYPSSTIPQTPSTDPFPTIKPKCEPEGKRQPVQGDCHSYMECIDGYWMEKECDLFKSFDYISLECTFTFNAHCK